MTPVEFKEARLELGLSVPQLGAVLNTEPRTIRKWEASGGTNARNPNPIACRVLEWCLQGYRPPDWPGMK